VDPFTIKYGGRLSAAGRQLPPQLLEVREEGSLVFSLGVTMSSEAAVVLRGLTDEDRTEILLRLGLEELEQGLRSTVYPPGDGGNYVEREFLSDDRERLLRYHAPDKNCVWQDRRPRGYICRATPNGQDDRTTAGLCAGCPIPDERLICAHLNHPAIHLDAGPPRRRVTHSPPLCTIGLDPGDGSNCRIGGLKCCERIVTAIAPAHEPPPDIAERAADEVDYFTLVYRDRYGGAVWSIPQARTIAAFFGDADDAEDFQHRVAALADLLARLNPYPQLDEADTLDSAGNRVGSLVALERLMNRDFPEAVSAAQLLRRIADARIAFPIHTRSDRLLSALRALGVDFPPSDWAHAWRQVLTAFWSSLRDLRIALQTGTARGPEK
jgi:hypothetical protein